MIVLQIEQIICIAFCIVYVLHLTSKNAIIRRMNNIPLKRKRDKDMTLQKQECIELIKSFIAERLDGDIQKFHDYDLDQLERDEKYGAYDPDNSKIANAIYVVLWGDTLPNLTPNSLGGELYRGDTMNSFNTLMGRPNEDGTNFLGIQKYTHDSKVVNMAKIYHKKYHTLGNLMVLPNKTLEAERTTLNQLRGGGAWYDYFDLFLSDIRNLMIGTNTGGIDNRLKNLVNINRYFFDCFQGADGFRCFCKTFYLDNYVDSQFSKVHNIFSPYARHWPTRYSEEEYKRYVTSYITKATEIIDYRCSRMIEDLEAKILEYDPDFKIFSKVEKPQSNAFSSNIAIKADVENKYVANIDLIKRYLKNVIKLESEKIVTEKVFDELILEKKEWEQRMHYSPTKKKSSLSLLDMLIIGAKTFGISLIISFGMGFVSENIHSTFLNILFLLIMIVSLFILPIAIPIYMKIKEVNEIKNDYNWQKEKESQIKRQGENALTIIACNQEKLRDAYKNLNQNLNKVYSADIIYKKYQTLEACSAILEYLESGRCSELEGPYGAYNKFDIEASSGIIIKELKQIRLRLDIIIENQYELQSTARYIAENVAEMTEDIKALCISSSNVESNVARIAENTQISAWSSAILATQVPNWHSEAIKKANSL